MKGKPTSARPISIRRLVTRYLIGILVVVLMAVMIELANGIRQKDAQRANEEHIERTLIARSIANKISTYKQLVDGIADDTEIFELLTFGDTEGAEQWARSLQQRIPQSIGIALVGADGRILGNPGDLRIGRRCVADIRSLVQGKRIPSPPVHWEIPELSHFDIVSKVTQDGKTLGMVFASFSLDVLQGDLDLATRGKGYLELKDGNGNIIARAGSFPAGKKTDFGAPVNIPGTDWKLLVSIHLDRNYPMIALYSIGAAVLFILIAVILIMMTYRLTRLYRGDLVLIQEELNALRKGHQISGHTSSGLTETDSIMREIGLLMSQLEDYQHKLRNQSVTDQLTGLLNRHGLEEKSRYIMELAGRDIPCHVILFDLDHFKSCNDRHGHGTGDSVLQLFADTLKEHTRGTDLCARLGGDEFMVILVNYQDGGITQWYQAITDGFARAQTPLAESLGVETLCGVSAGAARLTAEPGSFSDIFNRADRALYQVKHSKRGTIAIHDAE